MAFIKNKIVFFYIGNKRDVSEDPNQEVDVEEDEDGGTSPLYSNWDLRGMQHLLPLQDYIIQQAKLSSM